MTELRAAIIIALITALIISVGGEQDHRVHARHAHGGHHHNPDHPRPCTNDPTNTFLPLCQTSTAETSTEAEAPNSSEEIAASTSTDTSDTTTTSDPTPLEHAHWCRFSNGTYLPYGHTFMNNVCTMCKCLTSRAIRCEPLQCLPTYCVDNSMPYRKDGQCCAQCSYEVARNSCFYDGFTYPHG